MTDIVKPLDIEPLKNWGFAPGSYACFCSECGKHHVADKRAWRCLECAEAKLTVDQGAMVAAAYEAAAGRCDVWHQKALKRCDREPSDIRHEECAATSGSLAIEIRALTPADARAAFDRAIAEAEERGAKREREACAPVGYRVCAETRHVTLGDKVAAAIRARGESE